jgi:hypothetical protein
MRVRDMARRSVPLLAVSLPALMIACVPSDSGNAPGYYSRSDFQTLRWLEGDWRGTGGQEPFFEGYELLNDSTIRIRYYADSTRSMESGTGSVYYSEGTIYHEADGASWVVDQLDSAGVHFAPHEGARNSFRWTRLSPDTWEAVLQFDDGSEARYVLTRIRD